MNGSTHARTERTALERLPLVGLVTDAGPTDRAFDALVAAGPALLGAIALLGRGPVTMTLAAAYLGAFLLHLGHKSLEEPTERR